MTGPASRSSVTRAAPGRWFPSMGALASACGIVTVLVAALAVLLLDPPEPDLTEVASPPPEAEGDAAAQGRDVAARIKVPPDAPDILATGSGWGHGVGLSQYGAKAMAHSGHGHEQILEHYYPGTGLSLHDETPPLRVGLLRADPDEEPAARFVVVSQRPSRGAAAVTAEAHVGEEVDELALPRGERATLRSDGDAVVLSVGDDERRADRVRLRWDPSAADGAALGFPGEGGRVPSVRWGHLDVTTGDDLLRPTLVVDVERYLRGLGEVPSSWPAPALRAQAIAARTYALRAAAAGIDEACDCHLGPTDHDQVFRGWAQEAQGGPWLAAVAETARTVVTRDGELVWAYYSSSHAGRTEQTADSFAFDEDDGPWPSLEDPWSVDPVADNPRAKWTTRISQADFIDALGVWLNEVRGVEIVDRTEGGSPHTLRITGVRPDGEEVTAEWDGYEGEGAAATLRRELGGDLLPSQQVESLRLDR